MFFFLVSSVIELTAVKTGGTTLALIQHENMWGCLNVKGRSAKPICVGSNPTPHSTIKILQNKFVFTSGLQYLLLDENSNNKLLPVSNPI